MRTDATTSFGGTSVAMTITKGYKYRQMIPNIFTMKEGFAYECTNR